MKILLWNKKKSKNKKFNLKMNLSISKNILGKNMKVQIKIKIKLIQFRKMLTLTIPNIKKINNRLSNSKIIKFILDSVK
jgi:hypothetical protein